MKNFLLFTFSILTITMFAQNAPIDFEANGNGADWVWTTFENDSNPPLEIISNPDPNGINTSDSVAVFQALVTGQPFAGVESMHGGGVGQFTLNPTTSNIKIMVWKSVISDVGIKLVDPGNGSLGEIKVANTLVNEWEELSFDFSSMEGILYDQIVVFPDFAARNMDNTIYFDNIVFGEQQVFPAPMTAAPDPTIEESNVISMFSNVYTDVAVDTWQTPWSSGILSDIQIQGNDTKRYSNLNFVGVETTGANLIDASGMQFFHFDIWTPNMTTFRVKLVDFGADENFDGGDDSEHEIIYENVAQGEWISYQIPLADFTGLTSTTDMAQLIFSGLPVNEGVLYVDNVFYSRDPVNVVELATADFKIYPNPAQTYFEIKTDKIVEKIAIYNAIGELIVSQKNVSGLNISDLIAGNYFVAVTIGDNTVIEQLVKK